MKAIACIGINGELGFEGDLVFKDTRDLQFFKKQTEGKTVLMGRKTFESLPVKPLPNRKTYILSKSVGLEGLGLDFSSPVEVLKNTSIAVARNNREDIFVCGGAEVYRTFLKFCDEVILTIFPYSAEADVYFPLDEMEKQGFKEHKILETFETKIDGVWGEVEIVSFKR